MAIIHFCGNIGRDAELRNIGNKQYAVFTVADTHRYTSSNGTAQSETTWFRCMRIDQSGKLASYLKKGKKVYIYGEFKLSSYQNKEGQTKTECSVWVNAIDFMSQQDGTSYNQNEQQQQHTTQQYQQAPPIFQQSQQPVNMNPTPVMQPENTPADTLPF
jgi:single-strand DNA-binding protein